MSITTCIFDFDGTLMDSEKLHHQGWKAIADKLGIEFSYQEYCPFKSTGRRVIIPYLFDKANVALTDELHAEYNALRAEVAQKALATLGHQHIMPGAIEFVKLLKQNGIKVAVASSSAISHVTAQRLGFFDLFDAFVDGADGLPMKPQPDMFLHTAQLLGATPQECMVFEDSINGVLAANNAHMTCVGFQTYFTNKADIIIDSFVGLDMDLLRRKTNVQ